jgi:hypothetical protein
MPQMQPEPIAPQMSPGGVASTIDIPSILSAAAQAVGLADAPPPAPAQEPLQGPQLPTPATKPALAGRALGTEKEGKKAEEKSAIGSRYNEGTLNKLLEATRRNGVSIEDIAATAFAEGKANEKELSRVTRVVNENPGLLDGLSSTIPLKDIRNALLDANAMQRMGIDPAVIRQYIPGANPAPNLDDEVANRAAKYLQR